MVIIIFYLSCYIVEREEVLQDMNGMFQHWGKDWGSIDWPINVCNKVMIMVSRLYCIIIAAVYHNKSLHSSHTPPVSALSVPRY